MCVLSVQATDPRSPDFHHMSTPTDRFTSVFTYFSSL